MKLLVKVAVHFTMHNTMQIVLCTIKLCKNFAKTGCYLYKFVKSIDYATNVMPNISKIAKVPSNLSVILSNQVGEWSLLCAEFPQFCSIFQTNCLFFIKKQGMIGK